VPEDATFAWAIIPDREKLTVVLAVSDDGKVTIHSKTVLVGPEVPVPPPTPIPTPIEKMLVLIIEETGKQSPQQARVLLDPASRKWLSDNGHHLRIVDKDNTAADVVPWIARAGGLPHVFFLTEDGKVGWEGPLPETAAKMLVLIKKYGAEKP